MGIKVYVLNTPKGQELHTKVHDQEADYPTTLCATPSPTPLPHPSSSAASSWDDLCLHKWPAATWTTSKNQWPPSSATQCGASIPGDWCKAFGAVSSSSDGQHPTSESKSSKPGSPQSGSICSTAAMKKPPESPQQRSRLVRTLLFLAASSFGSSLHCPDYRCC